MLKLSEHIGIAQERAKVTIDALLRHQVCPHCILRALKVEVKRFYALPRPDLSAAFLELDPSLSASTSFWLDPAHPFACPYCLDCFPIISGPAFLDNLVHMTRDSGMEFEEFGINVTVPTNALIRNQAFWFYLQDHCGYIGEPLRLKDSLKWPLSLQIPSYFNNPTYHYDALKSDFTFDLIFDHALSRVECDIISPTPADWSKKTPAGRHKKVPPPTFDGVKVITHLLATTKKAAFLAKIPGPPSPVPERSTYKIEFFRNPFYVAGRYNKYSRNVSQSPWLLNGPSLNDDDEDGRIGETSTEELIVPRIKAAYIVSDSVPNFLEWSLLTKVVGHKFSAAGREDIDVRMLGRGRPFYIELFDAKKVHSVTPAVLAELQAQINAATSLIRVSDLQVVEKYSFFDLLSQVLDLPVLGSMTMVLKDGEETKKKIYRALVELSKPVDDLVLQRINAMGEFEINQKTPIRVLHRRVPLVRPKMIYRLKAERISPHFIYLDLVTQAGTYIKEFVHGDLGRTTPSFQDMLNVPGIQCDILLLDVVAVDLDFPPEIGEVIDRPVAEMAKEMETYIAEVEARTRS